MDSETRPTRLAIPRVPHVLDMPLTGQPEFAPAAFERAVAATTDLLDSYLQFTNVADDAGQDRHAFVLGLHGAWGAGKTSLMLAIADVLKQRRPEIICVNFQAWKYSQRESLARALLSRVIATVAQVHGVTDQDLLESEANPGRHLMADQIRLIKNTIYADYSHTKGGEFSLDWKALGKAMMAATSTNWGDAARSLFKSLYREKVEEFHNRIDSIEAFQASYESLRRLSQRPWLILIDDLDRCLPDAAIEVFEATKVFLDIPSVVFVLAVDKETIRRGLRLRYRDSESRPVVDPDQYIEKAINVSLELAAIPRPKRFIDAIQQHSHRHLGGPVDEKLVSALKEVASFVEPNPRRWIRLLNTAALYHRIHYGDQDSETHDSPGLALFVKKVAISYRWGGFAEAVVRSGGKALRLFQDAARKADTDFDLYKRLCTSEYPELEAYVNDVELFRLLQEGEAFTEDERFVWMSHDE